MVSRKPLIIWLAVFATLLALYLGFVAFDKATMESYYRNSAFYFILAAFVLFVQHLIACRPDPSATKVWFRLHWQAILLALGLSALTLLASPPDFRILADETNLLGTSQAMYESHSCYLPTQAWNYHHGFRRTISSVVDMRPAFFPFLTSLAHSVLGYSHNNAFVVNAVAGFLCLFLVYSLAQQWFGRFWGSIAMLFLASYPLFALYMTSAGFETVNLLCALLLFWLVARFLADPEARRAEAVFLLLPLLAQTRYESVLAVFVVLPVVLWLLPGVQYEKLSFRSIVVPLLFIPVGWLRIITFSHKAFQVSSLEDAFGLELFFKNLRLAVPFFSGSERAYGMVPLLAFLAVAGMTWLIQDFFDKRTKPEKPAVWLFAFVCGFMILHAAARFFYFWGNMTLQYTSRLGIIFLPCLVFLAVYFLRRCFATLSLSRSWAFFLALGLLVHGLPVAGQNLAVREIFYFREFKSVREFLQHSYPHKNEYIIVSDLSNLYVPLEYSAISPDYLTGNLPELKRALAKRTWQFLLVIQKIDYKTGEPSPGSKLSDDISLQTLYETQLNVDQLLRISKFNP